MTTTSVKDVGSVMNLGVTAANASQKASGGDFQSVFNSQTGTNETEKKASQPVKDDSKAKAGEDLRAKDRSKDAVKDASKPEKDKNTLSEDEMEQAMEAVQSAVVDLVAQVVEVFSVPEETVEGIMADMNLEPVDLLQPENMSNLLLEVAGAEDSLALLTDEQLYSDYQMVMGQVDAVGESIVEETGISVEALLAAQTEATEDAAETMPRVEVEKTDSLSEDEDAMTMSENNEPVVIVEKAPETEGKTTENHAGENKNKDAKPNGEGSNLVLETIKEQAFEAKAENVSGASAASEVDTQSIMKQIMDYMKVSIKPDMSNLEMQLHPASLGTLQIQVAAKGGVLTANFVTQNEAVKAALESQMVQLKESFEEQGMKVDAIEVTVQTHQFEQNLEQGRDRQSQETSEGRRPSRVRRINLGAGEELEMPEMMEAEDKIAAEMMAANGGTVDFTA